MEFAISYIMHQSEQSMGLAITKVRKFHAVSCFLNHQSVKPMRLVVFYTISPRSPCSSLFSISLGVSPCSLCDSLFLISSVRAVHAIRISYFLATDKAQYKPS